MYQPLAPVSNEIVYTVPESHFAYSVTSAVTVSEPNVHSVVQAASLYHPLKVYPERAGVSDGTESFEPAEIPDLEAGILVTVSLSALALNVTVKVASLSTHFA